MTTLRDIDLEKRETAELIGSTKIEGSCVFRANGERIGTIDRVMIHKQTGKIVYFVMRFGGFLGLGERYLPIPWSVLRYDEDLGCYEIAPEFEAPAPEPEFLSGEILSSAAPEMALSSHNDSGR
jgi:sporulation protein YlmC with PRC-barrel domain